MKSRKIIFLDIDGVLNSSDFDDHCRKEYWLDPPTEEILDAEAIMTLRYIVDQTGAEVVMSSSWREYPEAKWKAIMLLDLYGVQVVDSTPILPGPRQWDYRNNEIKAWLDQHPEVTNYLILDDLPMTYAEQARHQVLTTMQKGLLREHADKAIQILNEGDEGDEKPVRVPLDRETEKWFNAHPDYVATVRQCKDCGLFYNPELRHRCEKEEK